MSTSSFYVQTNLVSDNGVAGTRTDSSLVNAWGLAAGLGGGPWWVAAAEKGVSPAYDASGAAAAATVQIPPAAGQTGSNPTGVVANDTTGFAVTSGGKTATSEYVFVTENGTISGWSPDVDTTHAILAVDNSTSGAVYKGAAIASRRRHAMLYAADFHNARIDVFDANFVQAAHRRKAFRDATLPAGYAPFNVANVDGLLYVSYALQDAGAHDDVGGPRHGFVDVFDTAGTLVKRFASRGSLDSPWAMVVAPHDFGTFSDDVLVGNFGNGKISAFNHRGRFMGYVVGDTAQPLEIEGLWGMAFGNGGQAGATNTLFFAAGPAEESHGLFGSLIAGHKHRTTTTTGGGGGGMGY
jgi:uncharacterized protein (TIGR03118 family)